MHLVIYPKPLAAFPAEDRCRALGVGGITPTIPRALTWLRSPLLVPTAMAFHRDDTATTTSTTASVDGGNLAPLAGYKLASPRTPSQHCFEHGAMQTRSNDMNLAPPHEGPLQKGCGVVAWRPNRNM